MPSRLEPPSPSEEIRAKLISRLAEIDEEVASLRTALEVMDAEASAQAEVNGGAPAPEPRPQPARSGGPADARGRTSRRSGTRRAARAQPRPKPVTDPRTLAELERELAETGGASTVELARHTGADYGEVLARIRELERARRSA